MTKSLEDIKLNKIKYECYCLPFECYAWLVWCDFALSKLLPNWMILLCWMLQIMFTIRTMDLTDCVNSEPMLLLMVRCTHIESMRYQWDISEILSILNQCHILWETINIEESMPLLIVRYHQHWINAIFCEEILSILFLLRNPQPWTCHQVDQPSPLFSLAYCGIFLSTVANCFAPVVHNSFDVLPSGADQGSCAHKCVCYNFLNCREKCRK